MAKKKGKKKVSKKKAFKKVAPVVQSALDRLRARFHKGD